MFKYAAFLVSAVLLAGCGATTHSSSSKPVAAAPKQVADAACIKGNFSQDASDSLTAMSFNIRYDNPSDGKNNWQYRAPKVASLFAKHQVDLGGLQEVLHNQFEWLQANLPDYEFVGVGRDDGKTAGEYAPIFFRKSAFDLIKTDTVWLSPTPDLAGSKGWDAALPRITTFATLRHKQSGASVLIGSAHYDHRGGYSRRAAGAVIHDYISQQMSETDLPLVILAGDFNDRPHTSAIKAIEKQNCMTDARKLAAERKGPNSTWNGFRSIAPNERIDYVFVNAGVPVFNHVIDSTKIDKRYPSDHLPVIASIGAPQ